MAAQVTGEQYYEVYEQLSEIKRQLRQPGGYPFSLEGLKGELQKIIQGRFRKAPPSIFGPVRQVILPARSKSFVPVEQYIVDRSSSAKVKVSHVDGRIKADQTVLAPREEVIIIKRPLLVDSSFEGINKALEGMQGIIYLDQIYELCKKQPYAPNSQPGALLTNGWGNLFPKVIIAGVESAVHVLWFGGGWRFDVFSVVFDYPWSAGFPVFSAIPEP